MRWIEFGFCFAKGLGWRCLLWMDGWMDETRDILEEVRNSTMLHHIKTNRCRKRME